MRDFIKDFLSSNAAKWTGIIWILFFILIGGLIWLKINDVWGIAQTIIELTLIPVALYGFERSIAEARKAQEMSKHVADLDLFWMVDNEPIKTFKSKSPASMIELKCPPLVMKNDGSRISRHYRITLTLPQGIKPTLRRGDWEYQNIENRHLLYYHSKGEDKIGYPGALVYYSHFDLQGDFSEKSFFIDYEIFSDFSSPKSGKLFIDLEFDPVRVRIDRPFT